MFQLKSPNGLGEVKNWFKEGGYGGHFGFPVGMILAIFHLHVNLLLHCKYILVGLGVCENMSNTDFQYDGCGGHL